MALPATDSFTTGSDQLITAYSANWQAVSSTMQVIAATDDVAPNGAGLESGAGWTADTFNNDQYSQVVITALNVASAAGAAVRMDLGGGDSYYGYYSDSNNSYLFVMSGGWTQLGSNAAAAAVSDVVRIEASGTTITPKKNGSTTGTPGAQTNSTLSSGAAGVCGWDNDVNSRLDNWEGGNLGGVALKPRLALMGAG